MRWRGERESENVEDRRDEGGGGFGFPMPGGIRFPSGGAGGGGGIGIFGILIMRNIIEPGDIDDALRAASAIGDDHIQKQTQGYVVPDSGSSEQRVRWFKRGYESGDLNQCDTFNARDL